MLSITANARHWAGKSISVNKPLAATVKTIIADGEIKRMTRNDRRHHQALNQQSIQLSRGLARSGQYHRLYGALAAPLNNR